MEEIVDLIDVNPSFYIDMEEMIEWLNKAKSGGASKIIVDIDMSGYENDFIKSVHLVAHKP